MESGGLLRFAGRLSLAWLLLTLGCHLLGPRAAAPFVPLFVQGLELTHPAFLVRSVALKSDQLQVETLVRSDVPGRGRLTVSATLGVSTRQFLAVPILALALLAAWPHRSRRAALLSLAFALPLIAVAETLDVPYAFAAGVAEKLAGPAAPKGFGSFWWFLLDNGGRQLLALLVPPCAVGAARRSERWLWPAAGKAPGNGGKKRSRRSRPALRQAAGPTEAPALRKKERIPCA